MASRPDDDVKSTVIVRSASDTTSDIQASPVEEKSVGSGKIREWGGSQQQDSDSPDEPQYDFTSEEFARIPELVREVVGFEDDPTLPVITFRSVLLSVIFCIIGSVVSQIS